MNVDPTQLAMLAVGILMYGILRAVEAIARYLNRRGKSRVIATDGDAKSAHVGLYSRAGNKIRVKADRKNGIPKKTYILEGEGKLDSDFPTWFLHARHGWVLIPEPSKERKDKMPDEPAPKGMVWAWRKKWFKLRVPTDEEVIGNDLDFLKLVAHNPTTYAFAEDTNQTQDMLLATDDKKSLWEVLAPFMLIGLIVVCGLLIFLVYKISNISTPYTQATGPQTAPTG